MQVSCRWRTSALVAGALLAGSVIGTPLVQAATAGLVRIEGARSSHEAKVSRSGQLSVNAGLAATKAGQLVVAEADAASAVVAYGELTCAAGGIYKIPAGKALIITGADFLTAAATAGTVNDMALKAGPAATPCAHIVAGMFQIDQVGTQNQVFQPGIPVPAGDAVGLAGANQAGAAIIYGYLVPASAVPASALRALPRSPAGALAPVRSRG